MNNNYKMEMIEKLDVLLKNNILNNMISIDLCEFLDESIAEGKVLKVPFQGDINNLHFEIGALILEPAAQILPHEHNKYLESYSVVSNQDNIILDPQNPKYEAFNFCCLGEKHCIMNGSKYAVVIYTKIKL